MLPSSGIIPSMTSIIPTQEFTFVEKVDEEWLCSLCCNPVSDPVFHTPCESLYCSTCALKLKACTKCDAQDFDTKTSPKSIRIYIDKLKVACNYCKKQETRGSIQAHLNNCEKRKEAQEEIDRKHQELLKHVENDESEYEEDEEEEENDDLDPLFFNIGGKLIMTNKKYFISKREPDSLFQKLVNGEKCNFFLEKDGSIFVDCDPDVFKHILEWFKFGSVITSGELTSSFKQQLLNECKKFKLKNLMKQVQNIPINSNLHQLFNNHLNSKYFRNMNLTKMEISFIKFSYQYDFINCDFSNTIFRNVIFENCLVENANFYGCKMISCKVNLLFDQKNRIDKCKFVDCVLDVSKFIEVKKLQCERCRMFSCSFIGMDVSNFNFEKYPTNGSIFKRCKIDFSTIPYHQISSNTFEEMEINFSDINQIGKDMSFTDNFIKCQFNDFTFENTQLQFSRNNKFKDCRFLNVIFSDCPFGKKFFENCEMRSVKFIRCSFLNEFFEGCNMKEITFCECNFNSINFENYQFNRISFENCKFNGILFENCKFDLNMKKSTFSKCKIRLCNFTNSNLEKVAINSCEISECVIPEKFERIFFSLIIPDTEVYNEIFKHCGISPKLLFRGSRDGFKAAVFHQLCDNQGPTITIVQSEYGDIFGGFTKKSWNSATAGDYVSDRSAFIFKIEQQVVEGDVKYNFRKFKLKSGLHMYAICTNSSYLSRFGGGNDFCLFDDCNQNDKSYSNLGHTYEIPNEYSKKDLNVKKYLAGSVNFRVTEIEVFKIDC